MAGVEPGAGGEVTEDMGVGVCTAVVERGVGREGAAWGRWVDVGVAMVRW